MDLVTQTSLDALLLKATQSSNQTLDGQAVDAFCALIAKEKDGGHLGAKVIASRLPHGDEKETLHTLNLLDVCMSRCGSHFQNEVGKFRFLNEMIKLVSPKYLGSRTPLAVRQRILHLLYIWTLDYPKEGKIKEAFDMLRKQGVVKQTPNPNVPTCEPKRRSTTTSVFQDEEKSKILQKLLQSKDPEDIQAANWLIKSMVKEDDKRTELKTKSITELESIQNNVRLLNEMLDSYKPGVSSSDELELINELYQNCQRLKTPATDKLLFESIDYESEDQVSAEGMLSDVVDTGKELVQTINKFKKLILQEKSQTQASNQDTLLQFDVVDAKPFKISTEQDGELDVKGAENSNSTNMDVLCDIFTDTKIVDSSDVLQPVTILKNEKSQDVENSQRKTTKALEDLDVLGELLMKENLQKSSQENFRSGQDKIPMNALSKTTSDSRQQPQPTTSNPDSTLSLDLSYLLKSPGGRKSPVPNDTHDSSDDFLVDISEEKSSKVENDKQEEEGGEINNRNGRNCDVKLSEIFVKLEEVKPSGIPPLNILRNRNSVSVTLHLARDKPKENVFVYVLTTVSKNELPLSDYLFQAVVPKGCKLRLQPPSSTNLPVYNPFLPPSAITQILLIWNPTNSRVCLKFIVSYIMDDESITEMGEVDELP